MAAPNATSEKIQPWKAGWVARNNGGPKSTPSGTTHGFAAGEDVVLGGHTSGIAVGVPGAAKQGYKQDN